MTSRLKSILWWTPNLIFVYAACQIVPSANENAFVIYFIQFVCWFLAISTGAMAYTSDIKDLVRLNVRRLEVPYILELVCDGGLALLLATGGYHITAWVWFMQMIAVRKIYSRARAHFEELFMARVEAVNKQVNKVTP